MRGDAAAVGPTSRPREEVETAAEGLVLVLSRSRGEELDGDETTLSSGTKRDC